MVEVGVGQLWESLRRPRSRYRILEVIDGGRRVVSVTVRKGEGVPVVYPDRKPRRTTSRAFIANRRLVEERPWTEFYIDLGLAIPWDVARHIESRTSTEGSRGRFIRCIEDFMDFVTQAGPATRSAFLYAVSAPDCDPERMVFHVWPRRSIGEARVGTPLWLWAASRGINLNWDTIPV